MASDIFNLGSCLVNQQTNKDLDKIFLELINDSANVTQPDTMNARFVELMATVAGLSERLRSVESELRLVKSKLEYQNSGTVTDCSEQGTATITDQKTAHV